MTALIALVLNLLIVAAIVAIGWWRISRLELTAPFDELFRGFLILIAMTLAINMLYGFDALGWWPIWHRFE